MDLSDTLTSKEAPIRLLLVDNHPIVLWGLERLVESEPSRIVLVGKAHSCCAALAQAEKQPNVIVLDINIGGWSGLEIIPELIRRSQGRVLIHTDIIDARLHEDAFLLGAMGVVMKSGPGELFIQAIKHVHRGEIWNSAILTNRAKSNVMDFPTRNKQRRSITTLTSSERNFVAKLTHKWIGNYQSPDPYLSESILSLNDILSLYTKLGLRNRAELIVFAMENGFAEYPTRRCNK